jgi:hypothetical protein
VDVPFLAMEFFLEAELSVSTKLVQRDEVRNNVGSDYIVQSVLLDHSIGCVVQLHSYLQSGFF